MPLDATPDPSTFSASKCVVDACGADVAPGRLHDCPAHAAEFDAAELATYVLDEIERRDGSMDEAIRAAQELLVRLTVLAACRAAIARAAMST